MGITETITCAAADGGDSIKRLLSGKILYAGPPKPPGCTPTGSLGTAFDVIISL
jgi:hypothetical protein